MCGYSLCSADQTTQESESRSLLDKFFPEAAALLDPEDAGGQGAWQSWSVSLIPALRPTLGGGWELLS